GAFSRACGITTDAQLYCWGSDAFGQLGDGRQGSGSRVPVLVEGGRKYASVTSGFDGTCAVTVTGDGYCWGSESYGNLGAGALNSPGMVVPTPVAGSLHFALIS